MPQDTLEQRAVLWTQALVRVPSVSGSPACLQVLETARDLIESTGVEANIRILFPEAPNPVLLARTGRGKAGVPELMLSGQRRRRPARGHGRSLERPHRGGPHARTRHNGHEERRSLCAHDIL